MKLGIKNFAKVKEADIIIDGITVIAGENNTGKSTVGKILFSLFNSLCNVEEKILGERLKEIELTNKSILQSHISVFEAVGEMSFGIASSRIMTPRAMASRNINNLSRRIRAKLKIIIDENGSISDEQIKDILRKELKIREGTADKVDAEEWENMIDELTQNINAILSLPEETIVCEVISRYFNNVFDGQITPLLQGSENTETSLELQIKDKNNIISFSGNECKKIDDEINILHKAIYIDNPFIVDELSNYNDLNPMNESLKSLLTQGYEENDVMDGIIESVMAKEKLSDIFKTLQNVVNGEIIISQKNDEFYLKNNEFSEPVSFHNLSTGMKSFIILKMLLEKGCLKDKDVLVLDEPEIHLHPQWQIAYAELIVLLQKHFDLSIVVTTHSPYFVDAINIYSCKYGIDNKVNYYLSFSDDDKVGFECVTDNIDLIYKKMASPIQILDTLRYELNKALR